MQIKKLFRLLFTTAVILGVAASSAYAQGITTSALSGAITDDRGEPVSGVNVTITHVPSGTRIATVTRSNGQFSASGLRVGGPYTVTATPADLPPVTREEIYLELGQTAEVNLRVVSDVVQLEKFSVVASRDTTFGAGKIGTSSSFDDDAIANTATVRNSVQDIAKLDTRMYLGSLDQGGQLSAQGQNFRFNSFLVDGVQSGDPFGLNSNGFSSLRSPVPLESVQTLSVQLAPYDVRYAGFTGAVINAIVKSGTNQFHGSGYYYFTNENLRGENPLTGKKEAFDEKTYGATLGGPIIKDRLFFFLSYDKFERTSTPPQANFVPDAAGLAQVNSIIERAQSLGYDAGTLANPPSNPSSQETYIAKVDWNISDQHRLAVTYRRNYGQNTSFANYTGSTSTSLSNHWFDQPRNTDSYTAQLNSQWTPDFRTEATISYTKYDGTPSNRGEPFPMAEVRGISGTRLDTGAFIAAGGAAAVFLGTENSRQLNLITSKETQAKLSGEYVIGDHTITFGGEEISTKYNNAFVQNTMGNYSFNNVAAWLAGTPPRAYQLQKPYAGYTIEDAIARWKYDAFAVFIQDSYRPSEQLTIMGGFRYDYPYVGERPPVSPGFGAAGFRSEDGTPVVRNNSTHSGNATLAPRVGFTYEFKTKRKTQLRGGAGLFQGKNPAVWLSNAYSNAGSVYNYTATTTELPAIQFNPDPNAQTVPGSSNPAPNINVTDPEFRQPNLWKTNLAVDHELPFGDLVVSAEIYYNQVESALNTEFLNYRIASDGNGTGLAPDGRFRYGSAANIVSTTSTNVTGRRRVSSYADVFYLTNTGKGKSEGLTLSVARPMKNKWAWSASWTRGDATEVSPITSSTASSNYSLRAAFNPNEDVASTANTNIRDNIIVQVAREFEFIKRAPTTVQLTYQARSGHPYSWVFFGDANGDGYAGNDLFYVPSGPSDPNVAWADTAQRDAFFAFVNSSSLSRYVGTHPQRNSETSPWLQTVDLKITQAIPLFKGVKAELYASILNFANLFNDEWGIQEEVGFPFRRSVAGATFNAAGNGGKGVWNYTFTPTTLNGVPVTVDDTPVSRWQAQLGMRIRF